MISKRRTALAALAVIGAAVPAHADVTISTAATQNMSCSGGVCEPTATDAVLNVTDLENLLASGNVEVTTTGSGVQANNIDITGAFSWNDSSTLTLDAYQSLAVNAPVSIQGLAGLTILTNDGGSNGTFLFGAGANITFANLSSSLSINGLSYVLVNSLPALASAVARNASGAFALANNYDASQDGTYSSSPVPTSLTGSVEGLGNTVSNLSMVIRGPGFSGTFSIVQPGGVIQNLTLTNVNLDVHGGREEAVAGGLAAFNEGGMLSDDHVQGTVRATNTYTGGLVGLNDGTVEHSSADVNVVASRWAGGLVGENSSDPQGNGTIRWSRSAGSVICKSKKRSCGDAGGLVGLNEGYPSPTLISESFSTANVAAVGGLYADFPVGGGLVGYNQDTVVIRNSYATGSVKSKWTGGFSGWDEFQTASGEFKYLYATGKVISVDGGNFGGFVCGANTGYSDDYWDTSTSKTSNGTCYGNTPYITGITTKKLRSRLPAGFDPKIWAESPNINNGLPYLINNPPPN